MRWKNDLPPYDDDFRAAASALLKDIPHDRRISDVHRMPDGAFVTVEIFIPSASLKRSPVER